MTLARTGSRRGLTRLLGLPLLCVVAAQLGHLADVAAQHDDDHGSSHRRQRRKVRHQRDPGSNRNRKGKKKKKCARAGQTTNKKRKRCCHGLVKDPTGRCARPAPPPPPPSPPAPPAPPSPPPPSPPPDCATDCKPCETCQEATGQCVPVSDGTACNTGDRCLTGQTCQGGVCRGGTPVACDNPPICHVAPGTCNKGTGECDYAKVGDGMPCDDGNRCRTGETCKGGVCEGGTPVTCPPPADQCHDPGTCDPATGVCSTPTKPDGTPCETANRCRTGETCQAGACMGGTPVVCPPPIDQCHETGTCDPATGRCSTPAKPDGTPCDDGNRCRTGETCQSGECAGGTPVSCDNPPVCHVAPGTCNEGNGDCDYPKAGDGTSCDEGKKVCCDGDCLSGTCCSNANCSGTTPICQDHTCVACTTDAQCGTDALCLPDGSCRACDVICAGTPGECGDVLQTRMEGGGTIYVCPGRYRGTFIATTGVSLIGAGDGSAEATNTVLDANGRGRVLLINPGVGLVVLRRLRLTGGAAFGNGGGIAHLGSTLRMTECTVAGNTVTNSFGGGLFVGGGSPLEMTRCTVRDNRVARGSNIMAYGAGIATNGAMTLTDCLIEDNRVENASAGGIAVFSATTRLEGSTTVQNNQADSGAGIYVGIGTLTIAETCRVTRNGARTEGGGIRATSPDRVTLQGTDDPSPIVVDNCRDNCFPASWVARCAATPIFCPS